MQARLAVLIDAENVPSKHWAHIRSQLEPSNAIATCRLFGDFTNGKLGKWLKVAQAEALQPVMQLSGRNACDIAMTIAAMDLLYTSKIEGICLVSSDNDFTPLALRLRSAGLKVHGFGEPKAAASLRQACTTFTELGVPKIAKPQPVKKAA